MSDRSAELKTFLEETHRSPNLITRWFRGFYVGDLHRLFRFLVPDGAKTLTIEYGKAAVPEEIARHKDSVDYIVLADSLGYAEDVQKIFAAARSIASRRTRLVLTSYNYLWEPILNLTEWLGMKKRAPFPRNWLTLIDIQNFLQLSGWELVKTSRRLLLPLSIPVLSPFVNRFIAELPLINRLCLMQVVVARPVMQLSENPSVTVVIPARNEAGTVEEAVKRVPEMGASTEIIFIEGHSKDHTAAEIERVIKAYPKRKIRYFPQTGSGKGDAVRLGFAEARGDILMILDADLTVLPEDLPKFYEVLARGLGDFANGCRLVYPMQKQAMRYLNLLGNKFFSQVFSWLLRQPIRDTLCGTKVIWAKDYAALEQNRHYFGDFDPFGDFDLLFGASRLHLKISEVPIRYHDRVYGTTNIQRFRHGWLLLKMCVFAARKLRFL